MNADGNPLIRIPNNASEALFPLARQHCAARDATPSVSLVVTRFGLIRQLKGSANERSRNVSSARRYPQKYQAR